MILQISQQMAVRQITTPDYFGGKSALDNREPESHVGSFLNLWGRIT